MAKEFAESSTKELQSEITQLKEVNETCHQSNKMLEEEILSKRFDIASKDIQISELKSKLEVAESAFKEIIDNEDETGYWVATEALKKINT